MKIKIKDKEYSTAKIPKYNQLTTKLKMLLTDNKHSKDFKFYGVWNKGQIGILICGLGSGGTMEFERFYPIKDINYYFNNLTKRILDKRRMAN
jgi:hypothetical protein